jgi:hypothetical protein
VARPFDEAADLGVFVSTDVADGSRVALIYHDHEGDWVFLTGDEALDEFDEISADDLMLVCLHDVVTSHPEIHACADLPIGYLAEYSADDQRWIRESLESED